jgi:hypothetical protein
MPETSELGSSRGMQEPMDDSAPVGQESIDNRLLEEIHQLIGVSLGEGAAMCQVCGSPLHEGDAVVVHVGCARVARRGACWVVFGWGDAVVVAGVACA